MPNDFDVSIEHLMLGDNLLSLEELKLEYFVSIKASN